MVYCHGWPSSRLEAALAPEMNLRLIAFDRPGYGHSDPNPKATTLRDLTADVADLADHLGLARFAMVGVSGGGPLAAACAHAFPAKVSALALISAVPPPDAISGGPLGALMRFGRWPDLGRPVMSMARRFLLSPGRAEALVMNRVIPGRDGVVLTRERRALLLAAVREGLRRSGAGAVADAGFYGRPWGFRLQDIRVPTAVWHGTDDHLVPVAAARAYAAIPGATVHIVEGEGHYSLALGQTRAILADLLTRAGEAAGVEADPG